MPNRLHRYYGAGYLHFITTSCHQRRPLLNSPENRDLFLEVLERVRKRYHFVVVGYVEGGPFQPGFGLSGAVLSLDVGSKDHAENSGHSDHLKFLIKITSLLMSPRTRSNCLPSRDQPKRKMRPDLKSVICFAGPPVNGCLHKLDTASRVIT